MAFYLSVYLSGRRDLMVLSWVILRRPFHIQPTPLMEFFNPWLWNATNRIGTYEANRPTRIITLLNRILNYFQFRLFFKEIVL